MIFMMIAYLQQQQEEEENTHLFPKVRINGIVNHIAVVSRKY